MSELDRFRQAWRSEVQHRHSDGQNSTAPSATSSTATNGRTAASNNAGEAAINRDTTDDISTERALSPTRVITPDSAFRAERPEHVYYNKDLSRTDLDALEAFERAVDSEHTGKLSDAVRHYRDAFRLNERVDKLYREKYYSIKPTHKKPSTKSSGGAESSTKTSTKKSQKVLLGDGTGSVSELSKNLAELSLTAEDEELPCPILQVPVEILSEIFRYLALDDLSSFTKCTYSCKSFAHIGYTTKSIWMALCQQAYSKQHYTEDAVEELCNGNELEAVKKYWGNSFRRMYLERPRIRFDGVYISTCNYLRPGVGDTWNAPIHMVTYYRYCKFYEDGTCINLLTTSEPSDVVPVFTRNITGTAHGTGPTRPSKKQPAVIYTKEDGTVLSRPKGIMSGTWKINGLDGTVLIESEGSVERYTFYMQLQIRSSGHNRHNKLKWVKFWSINNLSDTYGEFSLRHDKAFFFLKRHPAALTT
ncbi:SCF ubiquitin ligase complex subunit HRT3 [Sugiyamaella lignohabitans]|uniref:SCF ubiquitin ligase complex subunit HRT3 n=1 Tax=Sugiyamaella lignohabitans TaxID=796027 RepID=A0A167E9B9_9ASCO|nr:SCF ubiquitin ligase complex subunit HRT3 [Sugiyamaella lignohabitans]ANB13801.1 SCF ubiquitin ligase complex subunit HRT3 [Sugiyamaella lignohabitans]